MSEVKVRVEKAMAYMPFAYYYIGPIAFISYIMVGRLLLGRFSRWGLFFCLGFMMYVSWLLVGNGIVNGLYIVRFFWGFLLFYLIFRSGIQIQADKLLIFLSALTILEAVLVNTVISAELLPNYPPADPTTPVGAYVRPYSFGGSASVTSVILVALLAISKLGMRGKSLAVAAISACASGSGFVALAIYCLGISPLFIRLLMVPAFIGIIFSNLIYRMSASYISFLLEFKMRQIMSEMPLDSLLLGAILPYKESMGGDFAGLSFLTLNGLIGVMFFGAVISLNINKRNWLPILIMMVGALHYGVIFYLPGQLIFGYLLNLKPENRLRNGDLKVAING